MRSGSSRDLWSTGNVLASGLVGERGHPSTMRWNWIVVGALCLGATTLSGCQSKDSEPEPTQEENKGLDEPAEGKAEKTGENADDDK